MALDTPYGVAAAGRRSALTYNTIALLGDSITAQNAVDVHYADRGYFTWANIFMGQAFTLIKNAGVGGERTDQIANRVKADIIAYNPAWCIVAGGTNDISQGRTAATAFNNLVSIYTKLLENGIRVVALTVPPSASWSTDDQKKQWFTLNDLILDYAAKTMGIISVDTGAVLGEVAFGSVRTGFTVDNTHPSAKAACIMGRLLADELIKHVPLVPRKARYQMGNPGNILVNAQVPQGTGGGKNAQVTGDVATGWTVAGNGGLAVAASLVPRGDAYAGNLMQLVTSGGSATSSIDIYTEGTVVAGKRYVAEVELEVDKAAVVTTSVLVGVQQRNVAAGTVKATVNGLHHESASPDLGMAPQGRMIVRTPVFTLVQDADRARILIKITLSSGTIFVGRAWLSEVIA